MGIQRFSFSNAIPGNISCAMLPEVGRGAVVQRIIISGVNAKDVERVRLLCRCFVVIDIGGGWDERGRRVTGGQRLRALNGLQGLELCAGSFAITFGGSGLGGLVVAEAYPAQIQLTLSRRAKVDFIEGMLLFSDGALR